MTKKKTPRMPDLELDPEASANVRELLARPSHPTAAAENLARAERTLRERRAHRTRPEAVAR